LLLGRRCAHLEWRQEEGSGIRDGEQEGEERREEGRGDLGDSQLAFACALNLKLIGPARLARVLFCLCCFVFVLFSFLVSPAGCKTLLLYFFFLFVIAFFPVSPASLCLFPRSGSEIGSTKLAVAYLPLLIYKVAGRVVLPVHFSLLLFFSFLVFSGLLCLFVVLFSPCLVLSCFVLFLPVLPCLFCLALLCPVLVCPVLSVLFWVCFSGVLPCGLVWRWLVSPSVVMYIKKGSSPWMTIPCHLRDRVSGIMSRRCPRRQLGYVLHLAPYLSVKPSMKKRGLSHGACLRSSKLEITELLRVADLKFFDNKIRKGKE
jgi:hypothetical protein